MIAPSLASSPAEARPPFEEAQRLALALCRPLGSETVALEAAAGRVLVQSILATDDIVPFARSAMDGFAVRSSDLAAGPTTLPIGESAFAEAGRSVLGAAQAIPIATGAAMPHGADAVVPIEETAVADASVLLPGGVAPGDHVFEAGDDARRGDVIGIAGEPLAPATLALLAANGTDRVAVARRPRVAIVTTGSEIVAPSAAPRVGQVRNSNGILLEATVRRAGADVVSIEHVADDAALLADALRRASAAADLVVTTGGASVGTRDLVKRTLRALGAEFAFTSVALRPGKPTGFARLGGAAIATLPGNPAAAYVALQEFVVPALGVMTSRRDPLPSRVRVRLVRALHAKPGRTFLAFASLRVASDGVLEAVPLADQCSSLTRIAAEAAALVYVPPGTFDVVPGTLAWADVVDWNRIGARGAD